MGKEKRLFLLAVMTVMMSTVGYGKDITSDKKEIVSSPQTISKDETGYNLIANESGNKTTTFRNNSTITVDDGTGIKFIREAGYSGTNDASNNKGILIVKNNGIGVDLTAENLNAKDKFLNNNKITINNATGIKMSNGTVTNKGTINITNKGIGIEISDGSFSNSGVGENGIYISGAESIGINQTGGKVTNSGLIDVTQEGTGIKISKGTLTNTGVKDKEDSGIVVSGDKSVGIRLEGIGKVENKDGGIIKGTNQGIGILVSGGNFTNSALGKVNGVIGTDNGIGIKLEGTGKVENAGKISALGKNGIGVDISNGEFTNKKGATISVGGSGIGINISGGTAVNAGKITVSGAGTGVNILGGKFENKNIISAQKGTGVALENTVFVNEGNFDYTGKGVAIEDFTAIKSLGGNNTVYLKNKSNVAGKIVGADGVDVLALEGMRDGKEKEYKGLYVENYEKISVVNGDIKIGEQSRIELEYTKDENNYKDETDKIIGGKDSAGNLTMSNSTLIIDFKDSYTNPDKTDHPIIDVGNGSLIFNEGMIIQLESSDGRTEFNLNEALGLGKNQIIVDGDFDKVFKDTAIWEYDNSTGEITLKKNKYEDVVLKSQLKDFAGILENKDNITNENLKDVVSKLETVGTKEAFTNAVAQISGGVHGYIVDFAALNARTMTNTMRNRALTRDYMRKRPLNSWTQDISYIDNNHRLGGLMNVDYTEKGVLGISEKQILPNGRLGLVYGGSKGNAKFEGGENGSSTLDGAYFGGYYNHEFNNKWSLNSNANFVYTHNKVTRNVSFGEGENKVENSPFKSAYPTYTVGMGTSLIYTVKDDLRNKAHFYAGVDVERIVVGNINENKNIPLADEKTGLAVKTTSYNARSYYSIVPSAGFMVQNTGYVFDRKYRIGADLNWETEVGNIKDGKRIKLTGLDKEYKIETSERENVFSYSLFGALDLTESLSLNARYTSMFSDEYDADMIGAGFEYKMDTMADNFFGTIAHKLENSRPFSDRWGGTLGIVMETDDSDDYTSYFEGVSSGDVATSMEYKPKITLSLNDKQSNWSYYFEAYHKTNNMFGSIKSDEKESHASRYHGEARWNDTYSKGSYGMSFGYRNENSDKSSYYATYGGRERVKTGTHELRITPSFTYDLGHGFTLGGKSAVVFMYKYEGDRAGQMDMNTESQIGITYNGFMPRWSMTMNFYREDTWYDHDNRKAVWKKDKGIVEYNYGVPKRDQVNQLRPSITYYFGNGANVRFDARIPLGNGSWADNIDGTNGSQSYETRYGFNYFYPVTPGLTVNIGGTFLNTKTKNKDHSKPTYGNITKGYNFRPNIGFYYSF